MEMWATRPGQQPYGGIFSLAALLSTSSRTLNAPLARSTRSGVTCHTYTRCKAPQKNLTPLNHTPGARKSQPSPGRNRLTSRPGIGGRIGQLNRPGSQRGSAAKEELLRPTDPAENRSTILSLTRSRIAAPSRRETQPARTPLAPRGLAPRGPDLSRSFHFKRKIRRQDVNRPAGHTHADPKVQKLL
jgi:hypothetical protein